MRYDSIMKVVHTAAYYRYSSDKQDADSIEAQRRACNDYAAAHGYTIVTEYVDEAISEKGDKTASRVSYQRMLRDSENGLGLNSYISTKSTRPDHAK